MEIFNNLRGFLSAKKGNLQKDEVVGNLEINPDAGAELLQHFHQQWEELHENNETNAKLAGEAAEIIRNIHSTITMHNEQISNINQLLTSVPMLQNSMKTCNTHIQQLCKSFEKVEEELLLFEDLIEQYEHEQKKNNHQYQLALYKEKKLANFEMLESTLLKQHKQEILESEHRKKMAMEERQHVFQDAFKTDMEIYKAFGTIPKIQVNQSSALLEEIQLDIDDKELMEFLDEK